MIELWCEPNSNPGSVVIRVYSLRGELLLEQKLLEDPIAADLQTFAGLMQVHEDHRAHGGIVIVGFDGDTGELLGPPNVMRG